MKRPSPSALPASLPCFLIVARSFPTLPCFGCRGTLDIHQPDQNQPEQILATCLDCGLWYRLGFTAKPNELIVVELPDPRRIDAKLLVQGLAHPA